MKVVKLLVVFFPVVLLFFISVLIAESAIITGKSSTVIEWFDDANEETAVPIYEYILLNVRNIDNDGLNFKGYGRLATDTQNVVDVDSRLYYAFLEKSGIFSNRMDFRFGRQFVVTTAGASLMDGLDLVFKNVGPLNFRLFGGGNATYYEDYDKSDLVWGAEANGIFLQNRLNIGLSYMQTWEESELTKELIGIDFDYNRENLINVYSEFQFNYLNNVTSYFLMGGKYFRSPKWNLRAEYLYSLPVFTSTSIYSVFAVDKYQELMAEYSYNIAVGFRAFGRYSREIYEDVNGANVIEAGVEKIRTKQFSAYLTVVLRDDSDGQDLKGFKARAAWLFNKKIQAGVGANVDVLDRRIDFANNEDETTSSLIWLYGTYAFTRRVDVQLKLERAESDLWDEYYRGRARLNISF
jgi:hypothetical protein